MRELGLRGRSLPQLPPAGGDAWGHGSRSAPGGSSRRSCVAAAAESGTACGGARRVLWGSLSASGVGIKIKEGDCSMGGGLQAVLWEDRLGMPTGRGSSAERGLVAGGAQGRCSRWHRAG